ncbi:hypothetical protein C8R43DRAFT_1056822 [Mycena crocata]|nr:hypothetical protein C8R43DRAFT_1056822 [Mycena crocata]
MLSRLSRARVPLSRYLHTQAARPQNTKYAIAVGTAATVILLGGTIALDSPPSRDFNFVSSPPKLSLSSFKAGLLDRKAGEDTTPIDLSDPDLLLQKSARASTPAQAEPESESPVGSADSDEDVDASGGDSGGGAYNPETGEINWDCSCLGGMAHGPCGPEFREAFSCFIYSEDEPKGINCVEKFQGMQTCFREHPEVYAAGAPTFFLSASPCRLCSIEIADDEEAEKAAEAERSLPAADSEKSEKDSNSRTDISASEPTSTSASSNLKSPEAPSSQESK